MLLTLGCLHVDHAGDVGEFKLGEKSVEYFQVFMNLLGVVWGWRQTLFSQEGSNLLQGFGNSFC